MQSSCYRLPSCYRLRRMRRHRGGFTLLQAVSMILLIGSIMSLSIVVLNRALEAHRVSLVQLQRLQSIQNFADRFRDDVQQAMSVETSDEAETLSVQLSASKEVSYTMEGDQVLRTVESDEGASVERFTFSGPGKLSCTVDSASSLTLVTVQVSPIDQNDPSSETAGSSGRSRWKQAPWRPIRVCSRLGIFANSAPVPNESEIETEGTP